MEFPLPKPTQESFTRWFGKMHDGHTIVYPGVALSCNVKNRSLRSCLKPCHVFIMQTSKKDFVYYILGNDHVFGRLSKRHYTICFSNVHLNSVPDKNRIKVYLTSKTCVELPFIPDDFLQQKRTRRTPSTRAKNKRVKRQTPRVQEHMPTDQYRGWSNENNIIETGQRLNKNILFQTIFAVLQNTNDIPHPFQDKYTLDDILHDTNSIDKLKTIISFVHHYAKAECGMLERPNYAITDRLKLLVEQTLNT